jgi:hypothetical protein
MQFHTFHFLLGITCVISTEQDGTTVCKAKYTKETVFIHSHPHSRTHIHTYTHTYTHLIKNMYDFKPTVLS